MSRHDWAVLGLIGLCALGSLGVTAVFAARWMDSLPSEPSFFFTTPIEVLPQPSEPLRSEVFEVTEEGVGELRFRSPWSAYPHASYGLTLRSRPIAIPFLWKAPKARLRYEHRPLVQWVPSPSYDVLFEAKEIPIWKPSERFD